MARIITAQSISAVTAAALVGTIVAFLTPIASDAKADIQAGAAVLGSAAKGDRLPARLTGAPCASQAWPNYELTCQFDLRRSADDVRQVRIVNLIRSGR